MAEKSIEDYINELRQMQSRARFQTEEQQQSEPENRDYGENTGGLTVNVTTLSSLYPVPSAKVRIFLGDIVNKTVIDEDFTDESGQTKTFILPTPDKDLSETSKPESTLPYARYNVSVTADGYIEQINLNVSVFSGVVSVQNTDLVPISAAGKDKRPVVIDEMYSYEL